MERWLLLGAGLLLALAVWEHLHARRLTDRLNRMMDSAFQEGFVKERFDESRLSALETKLARYLSAAAVSGRNLREERDRIQGLLSDISHQTKTPVTNLLLYAQLLGEEGADTRDCAAALEGQARHLQSLIDALVKTSRLETGTLTLHPAPGPLRPVIERAAAQVLPKAAAKGVDLSAWPTEAAACLDAKWTEEALCNLLDNAVKYTPSGGNVTVQVIASAMFVRIDVTDTGPGIPEEEHALVFRRFYRSPSVAEEEGVGIGLYLVRQIAAGQGGYVKLFSQPGKGARFSLYLPAS